MKRKHFFDANANVWDNDASDAKCKKIKNLILPALELKTEDNIIDIASGTGILVPYIRNYIKNDVQITELDFSKNMINEARKKFGDKINYIVSNIENIPLKNNIFSKAVIFNAFPHFENKQKALCEIFRILKNNAIILLVHSDSKNIINACHKGIGGVIASDVFPGNDEMLSMFENAGFKNIEIKDNCEIFYIKAIKRED